MNLPLISVVVPVYNVKSYLSSCIESVLNQTYQNFEIILVNDGSTDGSTEICHEYVQKDIRVILIEQSNQGVSAARNIALQKAQGEYITFLDSDDMLSFNALEIMMDNILKNQADICICGTIMKSPVRSVNINPFDVTTLFKKKELIFQYISTNMISPTVWAKMYNAKLFDGLSFPVDKIHEDVYIMPELFHRSNLSVCISESLYIQNIREGSIMRSRFSNKYLDLIDCEENTMNFISINYPEWFDCVVYSKYNAIASVLAKILATGSYGKNRKLYKFLYSMLIQEYENAQSFVTSRTKISAKYMNIVQHPFLFKLKFYNQGIVQRLKNKVKYLIWKIRS